MALPQNMDVDDVQDQLGMLILKSSVTKSNSLIFILKPIGDGHSGNFSIKVLTMVTFVGKIESTTEHFCIEGKDPEKQVTYRQENNVRRVKEKMLSMLT